MIVIIVIFLTITVWLLLLHQRIKKVPSLGLKYIVNTLLILPPDRIDACG